MTQRSRRIYRVTDECDGARLDRTLLTMLSAEPDFDTVTRSQLAGWIRQGAIAIDGRPVTKPGTLLKRGMEIHCEPPPFAAPELVPDPSVPFGILYEDEHLLVLDKPAGVTVHPGAGISRGTLVNGLLAHLGGDWQQIGAAERPGLVHRLDRFTSGALVIAKSERALRSLVAQLQPPRRMSRQYLALAFRTPQAGPGSVLSADAQSGVIDLPLGRHPTVRTKMAVVHGAGSKPAQTEWRVSETFADAVAFEIALRTGRTHQIRVHFQAAGAPLIGDPLYGGVVPRSLRPPILEALRLFRRQALHAYRLEFDHPVEERRVCCEAPIPEDLSALLRALRMPAKTVER